MDTFTALLVLNDAWFYFWHRLLHHPKLFRHVHTVHHTSFNGNYGLMFRLCDRLLGTELGNYESTFRERGAATRFIRQAPASAVVRGPVDPSA